LGGAKALGIAEETGSIEAGKSADIIAVNLDHMFFTPLYDPVATIVHGNPGASVSHVWVAGQCLYDDESFTTLDAEALKSQVDGWQSRIRTTRSDNR
jgi:5-methylthioadenosine/S-adenosylhomocysteine deaminase